MSGYFVSLSVVTFNNEANIGRMLDSLYNNIKGVPFQIYVIDNGSKDNTVEIVKNQNSKTIVIQNNKNLGFGIAHNKALDKIDSKYHVVINPDICIDYDVITAITDYMERNEHIGIISPKILYPDGRTQILPKRDPKFIYLLSRRISLNFLQKYRDRYEMSERKEDETFDIEFASGCFMVIRTDIYKKVGGFDERFFLYFEDADLSRSIRKYARVEYNPQFYVYHDWERAGARKFKYFKIQISSMFKYFRKWTSSKSQRR